MIVIGFHKQEALHAGETPLPKKHKSMMTQDIGRR